MFDFLSFLDPVIGRAHLIQYFALCLILLACGTVYGFQLAPFIFTENAQPGIYTSAIDMFIYTFPILRLTLPAPNPLLDSEKLGFAYLLDFLLKFVAVGVMFLGGSLTFLILRAFGAYLFPTLVLVLVVSCVWLARFIMSIRTMWLYGPNRMARDLPNLEADIQLAGGDGCSANLGETLKYLMTGRAGRGFVLDEERRGLLGDEIAGGRSVESRYIRGNVATTVQPQSSEQADKVFQGRVRNATDDTAVPV